MATVREIIRDAIEDASGGNANANGYADLILERLAGACLVVVPETLTIETDITPEMIRAGIEELERYQDFASSSQLVEGVFRAIARARKCSSLL